MKILLVYPKTPDTFWSFKHVLRLVSKGAALPPLGLLTIAALLPRRWELRLVDLNVRKLRDEDVQWADYIMISAMLIQQESVRSIVQQCKKWKKPVIGGGPLFTTSHTAFPEVEHVVIGEAEELMPRLISDIEAGQLEKVYRSDKRPDITKSPVPRWDLINVRDYVTMAVQFSRGCPFDCEFCDIIIMNGRVPRTKTPDQLIAELDALRKHGWRHTVFIVDDNFIGNRKHTKALLERIIEWRRETCAPFSFITEASVNLADDPELCHLMVEAGFKRVFVGIETPVDESLNECRKHQNQRRDLAEAVRTLQRSGLEVMGGFIVGFDHDPHDIFKRQFEFIQKSGVVTAMVGLLQALPQTRLYQRLAREGRLLANSTGNNTASALNFKTRLNRDELIRGYRELMRQLYEPGAYYDRILTFLREHQPRGPVCPPSWSDIKAFFKSFWFLGVWHRGRRAFWRFCLKTLVERPRQFREGMELAIMGYHYRRVAEEL
ncbi:MAG TPA: B12-binding domain-containing radical SAM protein [Verrucomicrobiota bacterium]|nr:B12-binding domain-containing radical SAM protein [Verrucomicrobiota bacterium]